MAGLNRGDECNRHVRRSSLCISHSHSIDCCASTLRLLCTSTLLRRLYCTAPSADRLARLNSPPTPPAMRRSLLLIVVVVALLALLAPTPASADMESRGQLHPLHCSVRPTRAQLDLINSCTALATACTCALSCSEEVGRGAADHQGDEQGHTEEAGGRPVRGRA